MRRESDNTGLWLVVFIVFLIFIASDEPEEETEPYYPPQQEMVGLIEGVVEYTLFQDNGSTLVLFDDGRHAVVFLGDHELHVGEWNQLRVNPNGYVEEVWLGEGAIQDAARY